MRAPTLNPRRRRARGGERYIRQYEFPDHIRRKLEREAPELEWQPVERSLREWLIACAYRRRHSLGMPSRAVDYAWHAFILDTASYRVFCERAYWKFLDHFPEDSGALPTGDQNLLHHTVWAWDRSSWSREGEATMWTLDRDLDLEEPWGLSEAELATARSRRSAAGVDGGGGPGCGAGPGCATDGGSIGCGGGGCGGGGGGCGGGG